MWEASWVLELAAGERVLAVSPTCVRHSCHSGPGQISGVTGGCSGIKESATIPHKVYRPAGADHEYPDYIGLTPGPEAAFHGRNGWRDASDNHVAGSDANMSNNGNALSIELGPE